MSKTAHHHVEEFSVWPIVTSGFILLTALSFLFGFAWNFGSFGRTLGIISVIGLVGSIVAWVMEVFGKSLDLISTKVAMVIFIISEIALFGGLFSSFIYAWVSLGQMPPEGTPHGIPPLGLAFVLSALLFSSSYTMQQAEHALDKKEEKKFMGWLLLTIALGTVFLGGQATEWAELISHENFMLNTNAYGTFFYTITGFHSSHVIVGLIFLLLVLLLTLTKKLNFLNRETVRILGYYWHFVDIVWIFVLSMIYIAPILIK
jgi:cytochrome c oxidase subunit 3